jgi:hypothetical protein
MPHRALLSLLSFAILVGCDPSEPCDPDQHIEDSVCIDDAAGAGASGGGGAGADAGSETAFDAGIDAALDAGSECSQSLDDALAIDCADQAACGCAAPYCAVMPGQTIGYCTTRDCDPEGDDCPSGYQCFDLSSLGVMGVPTFCVPQ